MTNQLIDRVEALVESYAQPLAEKGILCTASRRYFETSVGSRVYHNSSFSVFLHRWLDKREEQKKYHGIRNRYQGILLRFSPVQKGLVKGERCKEYLIAVRIIDRAYIGDAPVKRERTEERVLAKVEKRLQRILKKAQNRSPADVCRDTLWDALRYVNSRKYAYKRRIFGKDRTTVELVFIGVIGAIALAIIGLLALLFH